MPMDAFITGHEVHDRLPWHQRGKNEKYNLLMEALEEDVGKWHVFTFAEGAAVENARGAILSRAKTHNWDVTTSKNGLRLGVLRKR